MKKIVLIVSAVWILPFAQFGLASDCNAPVTVKHKAKSLSSLEAQLQQKYAEVRMLEAAIAKQGGYEPEYRMTAISYP